MPFTTAKTETHLMNSKYNEYEDWGTFRWSTGMGRNRFKAQEQMHQRNKGFDGRKLWLLCTADTFTY